MLTALPSRSLGYQTLIFGVWVLVFFLILHDSFPAQLVHLVWPQIMCQIMKQSKYLPLSSISI